MHALLRNQSAHHDPNTHNHNTNSRGIPVAYRSLVKKHPNRLFLTFFILVLCFMGFYHWRFFSRRSAAIMSDEEPRRKLKHPSNSKTVDPTEVSSPPPGNEITAVQKVSSPPSTMSLPPRRNTDKSGPYYLYSSQKLDFPHNGSILAKMAQETSPTLLLEPHTFLQQHIPGSDRFSCHNYDCYHPHCSIRKGGDDCVDSAFYFSPTEGNINSRRLQEQTCFGKRKPSSRPLPSWAPQDKSSNSNHLQHPQTLINVSEFRNFQYHTSWMFPTWYDWGIDNVQGQCPHLSGVSRRHKIRQITPPKNREGHPITIGLHDPGTNLYRYNHLCLRPMGGLLGYQPTILPYFGHDDVYWITHGDEQNAKKFFETVEPLPKPPSCFLEKKLILFPIEFRVDNIGHVFHRAGNMLRIVQTAFPGVDYHDVLIAFILLREQAPFLLDDIIEMKHFYHMLGGSFMSLFGFNDLTESFVKKWVGPHADLEKMKTDYFCFKEAVVWHNCFGTQCDGASNEAGRQVSFLLHGPRSPRDKETMQLLTSRIQKCFDLNRRLAVTSFREGQQIRPHVLFAYRSRWRRFLLQPYIVEALSQYLKAKYDATFEVLEHQGYSFSEVARRYSKADIVIGMYGAGLFWHVFMPPGAVMIELNYFGFRYSHTTSLNHYPLSDYGGNCYSSDTNHLVYATPDVLRRRQQPVHSNGLLSLDLSADIFATLLDTAACIINNGILNLNADINLVDSNAQNDHAQKACPLPLEKLRAAEQAHAADESGQVFWRHLMLYEVPWIKSVQWFEDQWLTLSRLFKPKRPLHQPVRILFLDDEVIKNTQNEADGNKRKYQKLIPLFSMALQSALLRSYLPIIQPYRFYIGSESEGISSSRLKKDFLEEEKEYALFMRFPWLVDVAEELERNTCSMEEFKLQQQEDIFKHRGDIHALGRTTLSYDRDCHISGPFDFIIARSSKFLFERIRNEKKDADDDNDKNEVILEKMYKMLEPQGSIIVFQDVKENSPSSFTGDESQLSFLSHCQIYQNVSTRLFVASKPEELATVQNPRNDKENDDLCCNSMFPAITKRMERLFHLGWLPVPRDPLLRDAAAKTPTPEVDLPLSPMISPISHQIRGRIPLFTIVVGPGDFYFLRFLLSEIDAPLGHLLIIQNGHDSKIKNFLTRFGKHRQRREESLRQKGRQSSWWSSTYIANIFKRGIGVSSNESIALHSFSYLYFPSKQGSNETPQKISFLYNIALKLMLERNDAWIWINSVFSVVRRHFYADIVEFMLPGLLSWEVSLYKVIGSNFDCMTLNYNIVKNQIGLFDENFTAQTTGEFNSSIASVTTEYAARAKSLGVVSPYSPELTRGFPESTESLCDVDPKLHPMAVYHSTYPNLRACWLHHDGSDASGGEEWKSGNSKVWMLPEKKWKTVLKFTKSKWGEFSETCEEKADFLGKHADCKFRQFPFGVKGASRFIWYDENILKL